MPKNTDYLNYVLRQLKKSVQESTELYQRTGSERGRLHKLLWDGNDLGVEVLFELEMFSDGVAGLSSSVRHQCGCDRFSVAQAQEMLANIDKLVFECDVLAMMLWLEGHAAEYPLLFSYVRAMDQTRCQLESFCYWYIDQGGVMGGQRTK